MLRRPIIIAKFGARVAVGTCGQGAVPVGVELSQAVAEIDLRRDGDLVHGHCEPPREAQKASGDGRHAVILARTRNVNEDELAGVIGREVALIGKGA